MTCSPRIAVVSALASLTLLLGFAAAMASDSEIKVKGFADVPGTSLVLPLAAGASPVTIDVTFGVPMVTIPVQITPSTKIKMKSGRPITVSDGDAIKVEMVVAGSVLRATKLALEPFPELELVGLAGDLPAAGLTLPLAPGSTFDFSVTLGASGVQVPVRLTASTKLHDAPLTIHNEDLVRVEAVVRGGVIVATKLKVSDEDDDEDD
jgi:hypothetical protein